MTTIRNLKIYHSLKDVNEFYFYNILAISSMWDKGGSKYKFHDSH